MLTKKVKYLFFFVIFTGLFACSRPDDVLSSGDMEDLLVDMHMLDGTLAAKSGTYTEREKVYYYNALLLKYHITKEQFDSSLVYYTKNPKAFDRIYSHILQRLKKIDEDVQTGKYQPVIPDSLLNKPVIYNLWMQPVNYVFTAESPRQKLPFVIRDPSLMTKDVYELYFYLRIAPSDSSPNHYTIIKIHYADGVVDSLRCQTVNDSILRRIKMRIRASHLQRVDSLTGYILGSKRYAGKFNVRIDSIRLMREYHPGKQDSLIRLVDSLMIRKTAPQNVRKVMPAQNRIDSKIQPVQR